MGIIETKDLVYEYIRRDEEGNVEGITKAVDQVDLDIAPGEFIAILGHNGSGKSTLAKHLNAILTPTEGTVWVDGMDTAQEEKVWDIRREAGMVFQNPDNQIIGQVVEEDVGFGPENMGVPTREIWERVEESLKAVGMYKFRRHSPNKLSGGQKQRVAIARAFLKNAPIVVLDEATSALDNKSERVVQQAIDNLMKDKTVFVIAHRLSTIRNADRIAVISEGRLAELGTHDELIALPDGIYRRLYEMQFKTPPALPSAPAAEEHGESPHSSSPSVQV